MRLSQAVGYAAQLCASTSEFVGGGGTSATPATSSIDIPQQDAQSEFPQVMQAPQSSNPKPASTIGHIIKHKSFWAALAGAVVGAVIGAALVAGTVALVGATGGAALAVGIAAGAAIGFSSVGTAIGKVSQAVTDFFDDIGPPDGVISTGSPNVFIEGKPAARTLSDVVACRKHPVLPPLADGSDSVFINDFPAVRKDDKDSCGCQVKQGASTVLIGSGVVRYMDVADDFSFLEKALLFAVEFLVPPSGSAGKVGRLGKLMSRTSRVRPAKLSRALPRPKSSVSRRASTQPSRVRKCANDPIDVVTGAVIDQRTDLQLGQTLPLTFTRHYNSALPGGTHLGPGWQDNWSEHLLIRRDETGREVDYHLADETMIPFDIPLAYKVGTHIDHPHLELALIDAGYRLSDSRSGAVREFAVYTPGQALLISEYDAYGNRIDYQRDSNGLLTHIQHSDGLALQLQHDKNARLTHIQRTDTDEPLTLARYSYQQGYLVQAQSRTGYHLHYRYTAQGRLAEWRDTQDTWSRYQYDADGRCISNSCTDNYHSGHLHYDPQNRITTAYNTKGQATRYHYNTQGLVTHITNPLNETTQTQYDDKDRIIAVIDPLGRRSDYHYDDNSGQLSAVTNAMGQSEHYHYDENHRISTVTDAMGQHWRYRYNIAGAPLSITSPLGHRTDYHYNTHGLLTRINTPRQRQIHLAYDARRRLITRTDAAGHSEHYRYDNADRLSAHTDATGHTTTYHYDERDRLSEIHHPDGSREHYHYDNEHNLIGHTDGEGHSRHATYGPFDLPSAHIDAHNQAYRFDHDRDHQQLTQVTNPAGQTYSYHYDSAARLIEETDYAGRSTWYRYDSAGQLTQTTHAQGKRIRYTYNDAGQLSGEHADGADPRYYHYDALGRLIEATNGDTCLRFEYDADGRLLSESQGEHTLHFEYDADGLRTARHIHNSEDNSVHSTHYRFDARGQLAQLQLTGAAPLHLQHDARGLPVAQHSNAGFRLSQTFNAQGQLDTQYAGHAPVAATPNTPNAASLHSAQALLARRYRYDKTGNPLSIEDKYTGTSHYRYDALGHITQAQHANGLHEHFNYNPTGQLTQAERQHTPSPQTIAKQHPTDHWAYQHHGGLIQQRGNTTYAHDAQGRLIEKHEHRPGFRPKTWRYRWNAWNQLQSLTTPDDQHWHYSYDALGRRIRKTQHSHQGRITHTLWDGNVIASEHHGHHNPEHKHTLWDETHYWAFHPQSFEPLAKQSKRAHYLPYNDNAHASHKDAADPNDNTPAHYRTWYSVNDHLGTPKALFTEHGEMAWRGEHSVWGQLIHTHSDTPSAQRTDCPLRFQGQYHDSESGLHYNRFRYYDPDIAQYISPDPIGLRGGLQPHNYVHNPNAWVDPLGLAGCGVAKGGDTVSIFKAPQRGKGASQYQNGYNTKNFCDGDQCAYFAKERSLAEDYAKHYGDGVIELKIPKDVYNSRMKQHEYLYQGGPRTELAVPHSEFDVLNSAERIWHK